MKGSILLLADGAVNLALGVLLLAFPSGIVDMLGVPSADLAFYPNILGAVLFGIGIALFIEYRRGTGGLGLYGAIAINICGGFVLCAWLVFGELAIPVRGHLFLWFLVILLVGLSLVELVHAVRAAKP